MRGTASDLLVEVWKLYAGGQADEARATLLETWSFAVDALAGEQTALVALRLLERLAPSTDDPEGWERLPNQITVYRAGMHEGFCWTTGLDTVEQIARGLADDVEEPVRVWTGEVDKREVLAYITGNGEDEIIVRWENVKRRQLASSE
jgi:hypothetical protein